MPFRLPLAMALLVMVIKRWIYHGQPIICHLGLQPRVYQGQLINENAAPEITAAQSAVVYKIRVHHVLCRPVEAVVWKSVHLLQLL